MSDPYANSPKQCSESVSELIVLLHEASNREIDQHNELLERLEAAENKVAILTLENQTLSDKLEKELTEKEDLLKAYKKLEDGSDQIIANGKKHLHYAEQARREKDQAQDKLEQALLTVASYKDIGSPKKIREQIKAYKLKGEAHQKATTAHKLEIKEYRKSINKEVAKVLDLRNSLVQSSIQTIWSEKGDHLMIFPSPLTMSVNGNAEKQVTLLFMDQSGCGKLIGIDEENEPLLCKMPKSGLKPKKATMEKAGRVLRKFKKKNWELSHQDLLDVQEL